MTVRLPARIERIVKEAVRSGQYRSAEEVLPEAVTVWQAEQTAAESTEDGQQAGIERVENSLKTHQLSLGASPSSNTAMRRVRQLDCPGCLCHAVLVLPR